MNIPGIMRQLPAVTAILNELDNLLTKQAIEKRFLSIKFATDVSDAEKLKTSMLNPVHT